MRFRGGVIQSAYESGRRLTDKNYPNQPALPRFPALPGGNQADSICQVQGSLAGFWGRQLPMRGPLSPRQGRVLGGSGSKGNKVHACVECACAKASERWKAVCPTDHGGVSGRQQLGAASLRQARGFAVISRARRVYKGARLVETRSCINRIRRRPRHGKSRAPQFECGLAWRAPSILRFGVS